MPPAAPADTLEPYNVEWARKHISRFGDTDTLPELLEFEALWADWTTIRDGIVAFDLHDLPLFAPRHFLVPKPRGGFRVSTQLDPIDSLIYSAIARSVADRVEAFRVEARKRIACAYRMAPQVTGQLFLRNKAGWEDFHDASIAACADGTAVTHVVTADISDFYNQIYHHRLHNAMQSASVPDARAKSVELFLGRLTAKQSRGVPVGPTASILMAEACLHDVDRSLISKGYQHTRYVDDFRIFCRSESEAVRALHDLTEYLFTAQRLSLQGYKTKIWDTEAFRSSELSAPEDHEARSLLERKQEAIQAAVDALNPYWDDEVDEEEVISERRVEIAARALTDVMDKCISEDALDLSLARYVLRRSGSLKSRALVPTVLAGLTKLVAAYRDVIRYVDNIWHASIAKYVRNALLKFLDESPYGRLPFIREWSLWLIVKRGLVDEKTAERLAAESDELTKARYRPLIAAQYKQVDWVRGRKESWMNAGPWERRSVLWSGRILPKDERKAWLAPITRSQDMVDAAVAKFVRMQK